MTLTPRTGRSAITTTRTKEERPTWFVQLLVVKDGSGVNSIFKTTDGYNVRIRADTGEDVGMVATPRDTVTTTWTKRTGL